MAIPRRDVDHIFERLRSGVVPERGLETFAVGIERPRNELGRLLDMAASGEGVFKFLRGGYGCGKTFMARLAVHDAQARGFATSFVVVSDNDLQFHKFDDVYRKVVQELGTSSCPRGALGDIIDRWIAKVESALIDGGADERAADFDRQVEQRLEEELASLTGGKAPEDLARVLRAVFTLKQAGKVSEAGALLSWLSGSENVASSAKKVAGIKGDITGRDAFDYLHGLLEIVKAAGYKGLVIVIDEVETILRMRSDVRGKSLNGVRQILDAADRYHGLLWIFTGTPELFDTKRGIAGLQPLHDRIQFLEHDGVVSTFARLPARLQEAIVRAWAGPACGRSRSWRARRCSTAQRRRAGADRRRQDRGLDVPGARSCWTHPCRRRRARCTSRRSRPCSTTRRSGSGRTPRWSACAASCGTATPRPPTRSFLAEPAELLMTTPESLEVMLVSPRVDVPRAVRRPAGGGHRRGPRAGRHRPRRAPGSVLERLGAVSRATTCSASA
jgi:hypothetical protein